MTIIKKKSTRAAVAFALALVMALSMCVVSASAATTDGDVGIEPNTQLWYTDNEFKGQYTQILNISSGGVVSPWQFDLGVNTIQKFIIDERGNYSITAHPQYFGPSANPYDDEVNAQYVMNITDMEVYNGSGYVRVFSAGAAIVPTAWTQTNLEGEPYLQCKVYSTIYDIETEEYFDADWNGDVVYLQVQLDN
jgi:hypothetical protein